MLVVRWRVNCYCAIHVKGSGQMKIDTAPALYTLAYYEKQARTLSVTTLNHAVKDITETLAVMLERDLRDPYIAKLMNEFDAFTVEMSRRRRLVR